MNNASLRHQILAPIVAVKNVASHHFQFSLHAPLIASDARAGQFIHVLPREIAMPAPFLRRAFSIMAIEDEEIRFLFRVEGEGTAQLSRKRVGENLDVLGPLGRPFDVELFHVKHKSEMRRLAPILVGGGVGVPPLFFLGQTLKNLNFNPIMLMGARSASELVGLEDFKSAGIGTRVTTDDGSAGQQGRVTRLLEAELVALTSRSEMQPVVYACGPLPMLRAVADVAARFGASCQVSMEENMPCGIGVCNGCVVAMKTRIDSPDSPFFGVKTALDSASDYGRYQRVCVAGPALWANEIDWEAL